MVIRWALYLVGKAPPDVRHLRPTIVAECTDIESAKNACKALQKMKKYSLATLLDDYDIHYAQVRIRLCSGPDEILPSSIAVGEDTDRVSTLCGQQAIIVSRLQAAQPLFTTSTIGGAILLDGTYYALTAAHAFPDQREADQSNSNDVAAGKFSCYPENSDSERGEDVSKTGSIYSGLLRSSRTVYVQKCDSKDIEPEDLRLPAETTLETGSQLNGTSQFVLLNRDHGWALVPIDSKKYQKENKFKSSRGSIDPVIGIVESMPRGQVVVASGASESTTSLVLESTSLLVLPECKQLQLVWSVIMQSAPGDCGSWVIDEQGKACAMIVAASEDDNEVFCLPLASIFRSIQVCVGSQKQPEMPLKEEKTPPQIDAVSSANGLQQDLSALGSTGTSKGKNFSGNYEDEDPVVQESAHGGSTLIPENSQTAPHVYYEDPKKEIKSNIQNRPREARELEKGHLAWATEEGESTTVASRDIPPAARETIPNNSMLMRQSNAEEPKSDSNLSSASELAASSRSQDTKSRNENRAFQPQEASPIDIHQGRSFDAQEGPRDRSTSPSALSSENYGRRLPGPVVLSDLAYRPPSRTRQRNQVDHQENLPRRSSPKTHEEPGRFVTGMKSTGTRIYLEYEKDGPIDAYARGLIAWFRELGFSSEEIEKLIPEASFYRIEQDRKSRSATHKADHLHDNPSSPRPAHLHRQARSAPSEIASNSSRHPFGPHKRTIRVSLTEISPATLNKFGVAWRWCGDNYHILMHEVPEELMRRLREHSQRIMHKEKGAYIQASSMGNTKPAVRSSNPAPPDTTVMNSSFRRPPSPESPDDPGRQKYGVEQPHIPGIGITSPSQRVPHHETSGERTVWTTERTPREHIENQKSLELDCQLLDLEFEEFVQKLLWKQGLPVESYDAIVSMHRHKEADFWAGYTKGIQFKDDGRKSKLPAQGGDKIGILRPTDSLELKEHEQDDLALMPYNLKPSIKRTVSRPRASPLRGLAERAGHSADDVYGHSYRDPQDIAFAYL
ncbi:hypothetical protein ABEF95_003505 [Exophiala dermatitidis]